MPTYRSVQISLISQFDCLTIPEYAPPAIPPDPFTDVSNVPTLVDPSRGIVSVYIPTYPCSQFWLTYHAHPPHPPGLLYYFKLFVNGDCLMSWGCGKEDEHRGKTMFGLYASPKGRGIERRMLAFGLPTAKGVTAPGLLDDLMEVRVFRAKGRKKIVPEVRTYRNTSTKSLETSSTELAPDHRTNGIELVNAGFLHQRDPQSFYKYALLDPLDQPYSTFRYYYRTWAQLEALGILLRPPSSVSSSVCSDSSEQVASRKSSIKVNDPLKSNQSRSRTRSSSSPESDSPTEEEAPMNSISSITTIKQSRRYRSPTPPPSKSSPRKVTFMPTATGLVPTNLDPDPLGLHPPWLTSTAPTAPPRPSSPSFIPAMPALTHQASRESFATLVRTRINSPNPDLFKLTDLSATIKKVSLRDQPAVFDKTKRERANVSGMSLLKTAFGRDNTRDESRDSNRSGGSGGSGRRHSPDDSKKKDKSGTKRARKDRSSDAQESEHSMLAQDDAFRNGGYSRKRGKKNEGKDKGKRTGEKKENEKEGETEQSTERERGRSRSRKGEGRKLNLWEEI